MSFLLRRRILAGGFTAEGRYSLNGLVMDLVADFNRDDYYYDECAKYELNGLCLDLVADFNNDFYAEA